MVRVHDLSHGVRLLEERRESLSKELSRVLETRRVCERLLQEPESASFRWDLRVAMESLLEKERNTRRLVAEIDAQIGTIQKFCGHEMLEYDSTDYHRREDYHKCVVCHKVI